jgi:hypothetical protein
VLTEVEPEELVARGGELLAQLRVGLVTEILES